MQPRRRMLAVAWAIGILGAYALGLVILGVAVALHRYGLITAGLAALAVGMTASLALKALAISAAKIPIWRRSISLMTWAIPALALWALAADQLRR